MAITFVGGMSVPADNGSWTGLDGDITLDPSLLVDAAGNPATAQAGDLVIIIAQLRVNGGSPITLSQEGGQSWTSGSVSFSHSTLLIVVQSFWCEFNGTWSASPVVDTVVNDTFSAVMKVFRPTTADNSWGFGGVRTREFAAPTAGAPSTNNPGILTGHQSTVVVSLYSTADSNNWTGDTTTGFAIGDKEEYRNNPAGAVDQCLQIMHKFLTAAGNSSDVNSQQSALNRDAGDCVMAYWYEDPPVTVKIKGNTLIKGNVLIK